MSNLEEYLKSIKDKNLEELNNLAVNIYSNDSGLLGNNYEKSTSKANKKSLGQFYTPVEMIETILIYCFTNMDIVKNPMIKILDPSCGSGFFLVKVYSLLRSAFFHNIELLKETYKREKYTVYINGKEIKVSGEEYWTRENIHYHIVSNCIYGADIDETAVQLCKLNLIKQNKEQPTFKLNVINCDSLYKYEHEKDNSEAKLFWQNDFDYIIGNPPWVSLSRKQKQEIHSEKLNYYKENYLGNTYSPNMCEYFLYRSMEKIKDKGIIAFILPDRIACNKQYCNLRKKILNEYGIKRLCFNVVFPHVLADSMMLIIEKNSKSTQVIIENNGENETVINKLNFFKDKYYSFGINAIISDENALAKIKENTVLLGDICTSFTGFIGDKKNISEIMLRKEQCRIIKGKSISKYIVEKYFYYDFKNENIKGGTKNLGKLKYKNKIIIRKTGKELIAAIDEEGIIIEQSLYGLILHDENFIIKYILAILNSQFAQRYYESYLITNKGSTPQLKKMELDKFPIKACSLERQKNIERMVNIVLNNLINSYDKNIISLLKTKIEEEILEIYGIEKEFECF